MKVSVTTVIGCFPYHYALGNNGGTRGLRMSERAGWVRISERAGYICQNSPGRARKNKNMAGKARGMNRKLAV